MTSKKIQCICGDTSGMFHVKCEQIVWDIFLKEQELETLKARAYDIIIEQRRK